MLCLLCFVGLWLAALFVAVCLSATSESFGSRYLGRVGTGLLLRVWLFDCGNLERVRVNATLGKCFDDARELYFGKGFGWLRPYFKYALEDPGGL